jgi:hypothetical protein
MFNEEVLNIKFILQKRFANSGDFRSETALRRVLNLLNHFIFLWKKNTLDFAQEIENLKQYREHITPDSESELDLLDLAISELEALYYRYKVSQ